MTHSMQVQSFEGEFRRYRSLAERAMQGLTAADYHRRLDPMGNSIAVLMQHLGGNLQSRFHDLLHTDGETSWRNRDREFDDLRLPHEQLLERWSSGWDRVQTTLAYLQDTDLSRTITIRRQPLSVSDALARSVAHVAYHTGQIVLLSQWLRGPQWRSLSVPRGASQSYLANPTLEKPPAS